MLRLPFRFPPLTAALFIACAAPVFGAATTAPETTPVLSIAGLGKGSAPIDGPWQFHIGDDPAWAATLAPDQTGINGWEQLSADATWGAQGHTAYTGFAWYRRHLHLEVAPGAAADVALIIPHIDDVYEIYWNGQRVGHYGTMPPRVSYLYSTGPQTFGLGPIRDGVLAIRVFKTALLSFDSDQLGGLNAPPIIGSPTAIAGLRAQSDYRWLQSRQYYFAQYGLDALVLLITLIAWLRDRSQRVLLAMALYSGSSVVVTMLVGIRLPFSFNFAVGLMQPALGMSDIALWYLLLYLLRLNSIPLLRRLTTVLVILSAVSTSLDGALAAMDWSNPIFTGWLQATDGLLTAITTIAELYPLVLVALALRKRLDSARWILAAAACLDGMISVIRIAVLQGNRFTHWTLGQKISQPLFTINGNVFTAQMLASTLLLLAILYAVFHSVKDASRRQRSLEQEFKSARELQRVLIPEALPELSGYAVTSAYRPAQEVGGDFFQIIPLEGPYADSTLILLGDVSGKGLKAAMTVSLIVGAARTLAKFVPRPAELLAELNQRLVGRMQDGFVTCMAMRITLDGQCLLASAGHPAPFLNERNLDMPGSLPLGIVSGATYDEQEILLHEGDHFALYTDGLLEARSPSGEIFSFARLNALLAQRPDAAQATEAAMNFGQEDDITVLTFTRLATGAQSTTRLTIPVLA